MLAEEERTRISQGGGVANSVSARDKARAITQLRFAETDLATAPPPKRSRWDAEEPVDTPKEVTSSSSSSSSSSSMLLSDELLDALLPSDGYEIVPPPPDLIQVEAADGKEEEEEEDDDDDGRAAGGATQGGFYMSAETGTGIPVIDHDEEAALEAMPLRSVERRVFSLLLRIKNGTTTMRKSALATLEQRAVAYGADTIFEQLLPMFMAPSLELLTRHFLVRTLQRCIRALGELVRPHVRKVLIVVQPLLNDESRFGRREGEELIAAVALAAGLPTMVVAMRDDIASGDDFVRGTTGHAYAMVGVALGVPTILPVLRAICASKKWEAQHTGGVTILRLAKHMGPSVLSHLPELVQCTATLLSNDNVRVRTVAAFAVAELADAACPHGIEAFDPVVPHIWSNLHQHRGKLLVGFIRAAGSLVPLVHEPFVADYVARLQPLLIREFASAADDMKLTVLSVLALVLQRDVLTEEVLLEAVIPELFEKLWIRRTALGSGGVRAALLAAVELLARRVGAAPLLRYLVPMLRDESAPFRMMALGATAAVADCVSLDGLEPQLLKQLVDGGHYSFQSEDLTDSKAVVTPATKHFATVLTGLGLIARPFLPEVCGDLKWRLNNKDPKVRQQAASLVARIAALVDECEERGLLVHLGTVLYERLGEEYPDVLGAVLSGLTEIVAQLPLAQVQPSVSDVILRLTPIMKNQHEAVQSTAIVLIGELARRGPEYVAAREWMRISFELLDFLSARLKRTRKAAVATFGFISAAIGPQDVLATLLNNLRVQDRQQRVCTTVAIAIVAESCGPFTVLPALINEYRVPDSYVQNGVIKSLSFILQFIGGAATTYLDAIVPVLADALTDRDHVHRQTAAAAVKHLAFSVRALGSDDLLIHLLNCLWPNVLETSPHVIDRVHAAFDSLTLALGPDILMLYLVQGLFHPAKAVRTAYWKVYENMRIVDRDGVTRTAIELDSAYQVPQGTSGGDPALFRRLELSLMV